MKRNAEAAPNVQRGIGMQIQMLVRGGMYYAVVETRTRYARSGRGLSPEAAIANALNSGRVDHSQGPSARSP